MRNKSKKNRLNLNPLNTSAGRILFIHQNFPGQFRHLAPALAEKGHDIRAMIMNAAPPSDWQGITLTGYAPSRSNTAGIHPWLLDMETKTIRGEAVFRAARGMKEGGYNPDLIIAHPGWGESLFLKEVWPDSKLGVYCEFFYHSRGLDVNFDPEFPQSDQAEACRIRLKNINNLLHFEIADAGIAPTRFQADTFPDRFRKRITVIHDGIDTDLARPNPDVCLTLNHTLALTRQDEIITFVNRNLEPYRGYHIFMRTLPGILERRPNARVLIVGGSDVSYGSRPHPGQTWKDIFALEARHKISDADWSRVHFLGNIPYEYFIALLQLSSVHVYLTYPFVLSWSLLEAMSCGCAIVAGNTAPVVEVITHGHTGRLVDFFDVSGLSDAVCDLLDHPEDRAALGRNARQHIIENYDLKKVCLPRQIRWVAGI